MTGRSTNANWSHAFKACSRKSVPPEVPEEDQADMACLQSAAEYCDWSTSARSWPGYMRFIMNAALQRVVRVTRRASSTDLSKHRQVSQTVGALCILWYQLRAEDWVYALLSSVEKYYKAVYDATRSRPCWTFKNQRCAFMLVRERPDWIVRIDGAWNGTAPIFDIHCETTFLKTDHNEDFCREVVMQGTTIVPWETTHNRVPALCDVVPLAYTKGECLAWHVLMRMALHLALTHEYEDHPHYIRRCALISVATRLSHNIAIYKRAARSLVGSSDVSHELGCFLRLWPHILRLLSLWGVHELPQCSDPTDSEMLVVLTDACGQ